MELVPEWKKQSKNKAIVQLTFNDKFEKLRRKTNYPQYIREQNIIFGED